MPRLLFPLLLLFVWGLAPLRADERAAPEAASGFAPHPAATGSRFMAVTAHPLATSAAVEVLRDGGSAVDAAIAAQMVLNLVEPQSSGIGGGGFLLHFDARSGGLQAYDGRETAPVGASAERFLDADGRPLAFRQAARSGRAVGVPGLLAMLAEAHADHGRLPWKRLFEPAIRHARQGFPVTPRLHQLLDLAPDLAARPEARRLFYDGDGRPLPVGSLLRNPELAEVLQAVAQRGPDAFYRGPIARDIVAAVRAAGGDLSLADLAAYRPRLRAPVCAPYRGYRVCGMPPPSSGGVTLLQILGLLSRYDTPGPHPLHPVAVHRFAEAGRLAYADRAHYLADPDFEAVPVTTLLSPDYLAGRSRSIDDEVSMGRAAAGEIGGQPPAEGLSLGRSATTHLSIVDAAGNAVALTSSIEAAFGSHILVRGFLLNNQLTDFAFRAQEGGRRVANRVQGGKRPLSSMAPTLVFDGEGRLYAVLGSPGGSRIINYVARALTALLDWGLTPTAVVALPHVGSRNGPTELEAGTDAAALAATLQAMGHEVVLADMTSGLNLIVRQGGRWIGAADPRREGEAAGD